MYPIGIPAVYAVILWKHRELLNPQIHTVVNCEEIDTTARSMTVDVGPAGADKTASKGRHNDESSPLTSKELEEKVKARAEHPDLAAFMFLWKDFGEPCEISRLGFTSELSTDMEMEFSSRFAQSASSKRFAYKARIAS